MISALTACVGGIPPLIYSDLGGVDRWIWFVRGTPGDLIPTLWDPLSNVSPNCTGPREPPRSWRSMSICRFPVRFNWPPLCCPARIWARLHRRHCQQHGKYNEQFYRYVQQTNGIRRCTDNMPSGGMAISGAGAGIAELTSLAATSEMAPTSQRGKYVSVLIFTIIPFCPSVLWGQLIASKSSWRFVGLFAGVWNGIGLLTTLFFYFPPPRVNSEGLSRKEILSRIDYVGGVLSIGGIIVFLAGMQWGGYQVCHTQQSPARICLLTTSSYTTVPMDISPCPRPTHTWLRTHRRVLRLGRLLRKLPHIPKENEARSSHTGPHASHHFYLRFEFHLCHYVLAHPKFQRIRTRSRRRRRAEPSHRLFDFGRRLHSLVVTERFPRP